MKRRYLLTAAVLVILLFPVAAADETSRGGARLDLSGSFTMPVDRYSEYMDYGLGGFARFTWALPSFPLELSLRAGGTWLHSIDPYADLLANVHVLAEAGFRFTLGDTALSLAPRLSGGVLLHLAQGAFNTLSGMHRDIYIDQFYGFSLEIALEPWAGKRESARLGCFVTPNVFLYPNRDYLGLQLGLDFGMRLRLGSNRTQGAGHEE